MEPVLLPVPVAEALSVWIDSHDDAAPGLIEGLYVVGSVALGDWTPYSDIEIVAAVVADPSDPDLPRSRSCDERTARMASLGSSQRVWLLLR